MNFDNKNNELKAIIKERLSPFVSDNCCLLSLPYYHENIGDFLIWEGVELFLKELGINCVYRASALKYDPKRIPKNTTILINGGGSFGDIWENAISNWRQIVRNFPDNKIIILPQTVFYSDNSKLIADANLFGLHSNLVICARDNRSFDTLRKNFHSNTILLVPDMAFYMANSSFLKSKIKPSDRTLFLKRKDKELNQNIDFSFLPKEQIDILDWVTYERRTVFISALRKMWHVSKKKPFVFKIIDMYAHFFYRQYMVKTGVKFINNYNNIFATRLHAAILCCLLQKQFTLFDNSYGKNKCFFETWLTDLDNAQLYT